MLNYKMPDRIGFGVARGTAFCLYAGKEIIDYSGQVLNLASRLNDFARPKGVVIDGAYMMEAIPDKFRELFAIEDKVFIRGIAESTPTKIFHSKDTTISDSAKTPIAQEVWEKKESKLTWGEIKSLGGLYYIHLPKMPVSQSKISAKVIWPNKTIEGHIRYSALKIHSYTNDANGPKVDFLVEDIKSKLNGQKLTNKTQITFEVQFVPKI